MTRATVTASSLIAGVLLLFAAPAALAAPIDVIRDCSEDGILGKGYSQKELSGALDKLPSDLDEYTDCRGVIRRAQLGAPGGGKNARRSVVNSVDTATPPTSGEQRRLEEAARSAEAVDVGGRTVKPGASGATFAAAGLGTDLPTLVLLVLIAMGASMLAAAAYAGRRRWPGAWDTLSATVGGPVRRLGNGARRGISRFRR